MDEYTRKQNHHIAVFMKDFYDTGLEPSYYIRKNTEYKIEEAQYSSSWEWLMTVVEKIEDLGFRVYLAKDSCQIYKQYCDFPDNFIIDADFKEDRLENAFDGISSFCEWWERKGSDQPALEKYSELQKEVDEFISDWLIERVIFKEEKIFETEPRPGMIKRWYPVHPKGSSNRPYLEEKMRGSLIALFKLKGEK
ncbi:hypothetical protein UFOVP1247_130 [uncultured Caudovirales phage]|uniref:Uncharacterized protein n=1 Tax=uncultured Caudovirales phage TaxID=2100421 RepID=A0A6J5Q736_9CAUD|nr:hypothetical protein UFOVP970_170 [uncultured Caudovirales phage]CAB4193715.1 hypothetical protein UFOVP1247_130 [uncultured Caudovirales phage]